MSLNLQFTFGGYNSITTPTSGSDDIASLRVVTRAQAREGVPLEQESTRTSSKKGSRCYRKRRKQSGAASTDLPMSPSAKGKDKAQENTSSSDKGGSVTLDKIDVEVNAARARERKIKD